MRIQRDAFLLVIGFSVNDLDAIFQNPLLSVEEFYRYDFLDLGTLQFIFIDQILSDELILERKDGTVTLYYADDAADLIFSQMSNVIRSGNDCHLVLLGEPRLCIIHDFLYGNLRDGLGNVVIVNLVLEQRLSQQEVVLDVAYE